MRRLRIWINLFIVLAPLCLLSIGAFRLVRRAWQFLNTTGRLAIIFSQEASRALGREVKIGAVAFKGNLWNLDAPLSLELRDVAIAEKQNLEEGRLASA